MDKTVFVTGSNRGLGKVLIERFAQANYDIIAHVRKLTDETKFFFDDLAKKNGVKVYPVIFDVTDIKSVKDTVKKLYSDGLKIDVLVNNAGIAHGGLFQMTPVTKIREVFDVNFFSILELTQIVSRYMARQKYGVIINLGSIAGIDLEAGNCAYGTSKAAVIAFTKTLAKELAQWGIRVNAVAPGLLDTDMAKQMEGKAGKKMIAASAMKRLGQPEEVANTILFLASDEASFINGQVLRIDGGM